jgi:hypothetical protein
VKAIRVWARRADHPNPAVMRLRLDPSDLRDHLLDHLRASGCLALKEGTNEIEVHLLNSVSERHDRQVLTGHVGSWLEAHPQTQVDFVTR